MIYIYISMCIHLSYPFVLISRDDSNVEAAAAALAKLSFRPKIDSISAKLALYIHAYIYIYMYIYMCVYMYTYIHIHICVFIFFFFFRSETIAEAAAAALAKLSFRPKIDSISAKLARSKTDDEMMMDTRGKARRKEVTFIYLDR